MVVLEQQQSQSAAAAAARWPASPAQSMFSLSVNWLDNFHVPWTRMPHTLRQAVACGQRASPADRRQMVRVLVAAMQEHCLNPNRAQCSHVAKTVVSQHPRSFADLTEEDCVSGGDFLGVGYASLLNQIKTRVEHVNRNSAHTRLRRRKRTAISSASVGNAVSMDDDCGLAATDSTAPALPKLCRVVGYGCVDYPEGETDDSLEVKRQTLLTLYRQDGGMAAESVAVDRLMSLTFAKQRELINQSPPLGIGDILQQWPFLRTQRWLCSHFKRLTGVDAAQRLGEALAGKSRRIVNYFRQQRLKWRQEMQAVVAEMDAVGPEAAGPAAVLLMLGHFREDVSSLFIVVDSTCCTQADVEARCSLPDTPRLVMLGPTVTEASQWMLSIEGRVVCCNHDNYSFSDALAVLFAAYYVFNIEYQEDASCTLEFIQRFLVRINPENANKCSTKLQLSRNMGRAVQRKACDVNRHVTTFVKSLMDFECLISK